MLPEKKKERIALLVAIGQEVHGQMMKKHLEAGGDPREICFDESLISDLVEEYSDHLEAWRNEHIEDGHLVDGDKIAAFTSTLIMRYNVFYSQTEQVNTPAAAFVNQVFALRVAELFTQRGRTGFYPPERRMMLHCLTRCNDHDPTMRSWTVATMAMHLKNKSVKEPAYAD